MSLTLSPNQVDIQTALRSFLLSVVPGIEVLEWADNRVPEPAGADFIVMTPLVRARLAMNTDSLFDCSFTGSIAGNTLSVSAVATGTIVLGSTVYAAGISNAPQVTSQLSGTPGGIGTYGLINPPGTVASEPMAAGSFAITTPTEVTFQLDVHGPSSSDNAQIIFSAFRDPYAVDQFATSGFPITPLYAVDPRQMPFTNEEQQYEIRWVVEAALQVDQTVTGFAQQFAAALQVSLVDIP